MNVEHLSQMVNDIAHFFAAEPEHAAGVSGIADHLIHFWDPSMRRRIIDHLAAGGAGLEPLAREAVQQLAARQPDIGRG